MKAVHLIRSIALATCLLAFCPAQVSPPEPLADAIATELDGALFLGASLTTATCHRFYDATVLEHGRVDPLLVYLAAQAADRSDVRLAAQLMQVHVLWRLGDLAQAVDILTPLTEGTTDPQLTLTHAQLLDALGRDQDALTAYERVLAATTDDQVRGLILLRTALLKPPTADAPSPLAQFASSLPESDPLRNRAAMILGLLDRQKDAIQIYRLRADSPSLFQEAIRLAEWALEAGEHARAEEFSRTATNASKLKRDRRYALTVRAEAARRSKTLDSLIQELRDLPAPTKEHQDLLIDLLRETGRAKEALELFRASTVDSFSVDMRRELLEMCRDLEDDDLLLSTYREMIAAQPRFIEWREGLSRFYLERGERAQAEKVWQDYQQVTQDFRYLLAAASSAEKSGLPELALRLATHPDLSDAERHQARLFAFEVHLERGEFDKAREALEQLDKEAAPDSTIRGDLADAFIRLGDRNRAVVVLTGLQQALGNLVGSDLEMRLAVLLSEIGKEDDALDMWMSLWRKTNSVPRRRYVEDRIMTVSGRLGKLAAIAVDLEKRLARGEASDLESGLLVRIYTKVNDSVSATEVLSEHMKKSGGQEVETLNEKARVYLACNDYFHYEQTIQQLAAIDPDNAPDYLRQLAMSSLERGQRREAWQILSRLRDEESSAYSDEFEAGILALAGLRVEAEQAYRKGLVRQPDRIDGYLLLSNIQKELDQHVRSSGMFQYLAETAEKDDLFTIAIDGILNMRDDRGNRGAPDRLIRWARRITLERIAESPDKLYLYQLLSDLAAELRDPAGSVRAMTAGIPIAGEQRTPLLRELMSLTKGRDSDRDHRMFGKRLIGQGDLVPPDVYMELGTSFLKAGDVASATRTFRGAESLPEYTELLPQIAIAFQTEKYPREALRIFETLMSSSKPTPLIQLTVAELHEQLGRREVAFDLFRRALEELLLSRPLVTDRAATETSKAEEQLYYFGRNTDEFEQFKNELLTGLLANMRGAGAYETWMEQATKALQGDLSALPLLPDVATRRLAQAPRVRDRLDLARRVCLAHQDVPGAQAFDQMVMSQFPGDGDLLGEACRVRIMWGYRRAAVQLIELSSAEDDRKIDARLLVGGSIESSGGRLLSPREAVRDLLPLIAGGDRNVLRDFLIRVDGTKSQEGSEDALLQLAEVAALVGEADMVLMFLRQYVNEAIRSKGHPYSMISLVLQRAQRLLDSDRRGSLVLHLVQSILDKPDKANAIIHRLQDLRAEYGGEVLSIDQVETLLRKSLELAEDRGLYQVPPLIAAAAPEERARLFRMVLEKAPKSHHFRLFCDIMPSLEAPVPSGSDEVLLETIVASITEVKDEWHFSQVDELAGTPAPNLPLALQMVDAIQKVRSTTPGLGTARASILKKLDRKQDALLEALSTYERLLPSLAPDNWQIQHELSAVRSLFPDEAQAFLLVLDRLQARIQTSTAPILRERLSLISQLGRTKDVLPEIQKAIAQFPEEADFHGLLLDHYRANGDTPGMIRHLEDRLSARPQDPSAAADLADTYIRSHHFRKASEVLHRQKLNNDAGDGPSLEISSARAPVANMQLVRSLWDAAKIEEAATAFRRVWRRFPDSRESNRRFFSFRSLTRFPWPVDQVVKPAALPRGGMPALDPPDLLALIATGIGENPEEDDEAEAEDVPASPPLLASDVLRTEPAGLLELRDWLRTLEAKDQDSDVAVDLLLASLTNGSAPTANEDVENLLLQTIRSGHGGRLHHAALFRMLEANPERENSQIALVIDELLATLLPGESNQIRRLAKLYSVFGQGERAANLYKWCSRDLSHLSNLNTLSLLYPGGGSLPRTRPGARTHSLLDEMISAFRGEEREQIISTILSAGDPGPSGWNRDAHGVASLMTWSRFLRGDALKQRVGPILARLEQPESSATPQRQTAACSISILLHLGQVEDALRSLEYAACSMDAPATTKSWYREQFTSPPILRFAQARMLFPRAADHTPTREYLRHAMDRIVAWDRASRIDQDSLLEIYAFLTIRLHDCGEIDSRDIGMDRVKDLAGRDQGRALWLADLLRACGLSKEPNATERALLESMRLPMGRVPEVLERISTEESPEAALALARPLLEWCGHSVVLESIERVMIRANLPDEAEALKVWRERNAALQADARKGLAELRRRR